MPVRWSFVSVRKFCHITVWRGANILIRALDISSLKTAIKIIKSILHDLVTLLTKTQPYIYICRQQGLLTLRPELFHQQQQVVLQQGGQQGSDLERRK